MALKKYLCLAVFKLEHYKKISLIRPILRDLDNLLCVYECDNLGNKVCTVRRNLKAHRGPLRKEEKKEINQLVEELKNFILLNAESVS